jgi:hypothetical protein
VAEHTSQVDLMPACLSLLSDCFDLPLTLEYDRPQSLEAQSGLFVEEPAEVIVVSRVVLTSVQDSVGVLLAEWKNKVIELFVGHSAEQFPVRSVEHHQDVVCAKVVEVQVVSQTLSQVLLGDAAEALAVEQAKGVD